MNSIPSVPIIRFELEGMKRTVVAALMEHQGQMNQDIQDAVNSYCTPENIRSVIHASAYRALDAVIKEEVDKFFRYGEGRKQIAEVIKEKLLKKETYGPLDDV
jgi:hypothetical protein